MYLKFTMIFIVLEKMPKIFTNRVENLLPFTQSQSYSFAECVAPGYAAGIGVGVNRLRVSHSERGLRLQAAKPYEAPSQTGLSPLGETEALVVLSCQNEHRGTAPPLRRVTKAAENPKLSRLG